MSDSRTQKLLNMSTKTETRRVDIVKVTMDDSILHMEYLNWHWLRWFQRRQFLRQGADPDH
jgi:hypothetical protein